jgi:hypothetical protein
MWEFFDHHEVLCAFALLLGVPSGFMLGVLLIQTWGARRR